MRARPFAICQLAAPVIVRASANLIVALPAGWSDSCIRFLAACVPGGGMAMKMERLWVQLRMVALVAVLYGHDVQSSAVCYRILICLANTKIAGADLAAPGGDQMGSDPIALGARTVAADVAKRVAWRVSGSGPLAALFDGLTGVSSAALVLRARDHFRPQNTISFVWLLALGFFCIATKVVGPMLVLAELCLRGVDILMEIRPVSWLLRSGAGIAFMPQLCTAAVVAGCLFIAATASWRLGVVGCQLARRTPSSLTFLLFLVPPSVQAVLAFSASSEMLMAWADGSLLSISNGAGTATVIGLSYHAHNAFYGFMSVAAQRTAAPFLVRFHQLLQYSLAYWPAGAHHVLLPINLLRPESK